MMHKRTLLTTATAVGVIPAAPAILRANNMSGVTASEIRIGNTMPYKWPGFRLQHDRQGDRGYVPYANDRGGVAGQKVNFILYDDGYSLAKTVEQTRRLVKEDRVAALFAQSGTPTNSAIVAMSIKKRARNCS